LITNVFYLEFGGNICKLFKSFNVIINFKSSFNKFLKHKNTIPETDDYQYLNIFLFDCVFGPFSS